MLLLLNKSKNLFYHLWIKLIFFCEFCLISEMRRNIWTFDRHRWSNRWSNFSVSFRFVALKLPLFIRVALLSHWFSKISSVPLDHKWHHHDPSFSLSSAWLSPQVSYPLSKHTPNQDALIRLWNRFCHPMKKKNRCDVVERNRGSWLLRTFLKPSL